MRASGCTRVGYRWSPLGWLARCFPFRSGAHIYPLAPAPEIAEPDLIAAAKRLIALEK